MQHWLTRGVAEQHSHASSVDVRRQLVQDLDGVVVELGVGAWPALGFYGRAASVIGIEPRAALWHDSHRSAQELGSGRARVVGGQAERLPIATGVVDHVVVAFVLCSVMSVELTLDEIGRVLRPGGTFSFVEHVPMRGPRGWRQRVADLSPAVRRRGGCRQRHDPRSAIAEVFGAVDMAEQTVVRRNGRPSRVVLGRACRE